MRHTIDFILEYGLTNYRKSFSSSSDGYPDDGKWYRRMDTGFVCGDNYIVIRCTNPSELIYEVIKSEFKTCKSCLHYRTMSDACTEPSNQTYAPENINFVGCNLWKGATND